MHVALGFPIVCPTVSIEREQIKDMVMRNIPIPIRFNIPGVYFSI